MMCPHFGNGVGRHTHAWMNTEAGYLSFRIQRFVARNTGQRVERGHAAVSRSQSR